MADSAPVSKDDLWDVRNQLSLSLKDGFDGVHTRLDSLNGRTRKVETVTAVHSWAIGLIGAGGAALFAALFAWLFTKL